MNKEHVENTDQYLVVGSNFFALEAHYKLQQRVDSKQLQLIVEEAIDLEALLRNVLSYCRGEDNLARLKSFLDESDHAALLNTVPSLFYKEMKFRSFGGRSKSSTMLGGESFFSRPGATVAPEKLFSFLQDSDYLSRLGDLAVECPLKSVRQEGSDQWIITTINEKNYSGKHLIWGESPYRLGELSTQTDLFDHNFMQFAQFARGDALLMLHFEFKQRVTEQLETVMIPRSATHEHGHYIGQFIQDESGLHRASFATFVDRNLGSSEEVARMVRSLKRRLDKIFPGFTQQMDREFISLANDSFGETLDDKLVKLEQLLGVGVRFVGPNAPLPAQEQKLSSLSHWGRGVASLEEVV
jgi:hypothetical protein